MLSENFSALLRPYKSLILVALVGVTVTTSLTVYTRRKLELAHQKEILADQYRQEGQAAWKEAYSLKDYADQLQVDLKKANAKIDKLRAAVDKIQVPPKPGPAPEQKQQLISDLQGMGLQLVVKPSTSIAPALVGITEDDGKTIWGWGKENLRVPFLEQKIVAQQNLVTGLTSAKEVAEKLADSRSQQADAAMKAADAHQKEADALRVVVKDAKKAMSAEQKKKYLYLAGGILTGYAVDRAIHR